MLITVYNFVNAIDVDITNEKVKKYERENQQQILHNQARKTDEDKKVNELIQAEDDRMRVQNYMREKPY